MEGYFGHFSDSELVVERLSVDIFSNKEKRPKFSLLNPIKITWSHI